MVPALKVSKCCLWSPLALSWAHAGHGNEGVAQPTGWSLWVRISTSFVKDGLERRAAPILFQQIESSRGLSAPDTPWDLKNLVWHFSHMDY